MSIEYKLSEDGKQATWEDDGVKYTAISKKTTIFAALDETHKISLQSLQFNETDLVLGNSGAPVPNSEIRGPQLAVASAKVMEVCTEEEIKLFNDVLQRIFAPAVIWEKERPERERLEEEARIQEIEDKKAQAILDAKTETE